MITMSDVISAKRLELDLQSTTPAGAIHEVAGLLRGDERVLDWSGLVGSLRYANSCIASQSGHAICIPHARTSFVSTMVMAAGRSREGVWFEENALRVHYLFVIGVPVAMASDYLRIIGAIARIFKVPENEEALLNTANKQAFLDLLAAGEMK